MRPNPLSDHSFPPPFPPGHQAELRALPAVLLWSPPSGTFVSVFQAATQLADQSLNFIPKLAALVEGAKIASGRLGMGG